MRPHNLFDLLSYVLHHPRNQRQLLDFLDNSGTCPEPGSTLCWPLFQNFIPANTQHTSVETAEVRYVYQLLEDLYIVLITNKASNILQDIETLHLFARVVSDLCRSADQREIAKNSFELLGAFDEIVSLGYREQVNLMQVRSILEMESHEEKIQEIIARVCSVHQAASVLNDIPCRIKRPRPKRS